ADRIRAFRGRADRRRRPVEAPSWRERQGRPCSTLCAPPLSMSISEPFIRRPIATTLLAAGLLLVGVVAFPLLPIAPLPQVDFPTIQVSASLPGASPETMASAVAQPLETQFAHITRVAQMG